MAALRPSEVVALDVCDVRRNCDAGMKGSGIYIKVGKMTLRGTAC